MPLHIESKNIITLMLTISCIPSARPKSLLAENPTALPVAPSRFMASLHRDPYVVSLDHYASTAARYSFVRLATYIS